MANPRVPMYENPEIFFKGLGMMVFSLRRGVVAWSHMPFFPHRTVKNPPWGGEFFAIQF